MGNIHIENMFTRKSAIRRRGETLVKYTTASGLDDWIGNISGQLVGSNSTTPTTQIPNVNYAEEIYLNDGVTFGAFVFSNCSQLKNLTIPSSVTSFEGYTFYKCNNLKNITMPNGMTRIYNSTFFKCYALTDIAIPNSVSYIEEYAFADCSGLTKITFGSNVSNIQYQAFENCSNCMIFDFRRSTSIPSLGNVSVFENTSSNKEIIVPDNLYDDWIAASNWSSTTNNIVNCIVKASQSSLGPLAT